MWLGSFFQDRCPDKNLIEALNIKYHELGGVDDVTLDNYEELFQELLPPFTEISIRFHGGVVYAGIYPVENFEWISEQEGIPWIEDVFCDTPSDYNGYLFEQNEHFTSLYYCQSPGVLTPLWRM